MRCSICGIRIDSVDEAVKAGWTPCFYDGETEHESACQDCLEALLQIREDGEMEVKEEYRGKLIYFDKETRDQSGEENLAKEIFFSRENENRRN
jgi:hypothetical protein